MPIQNVNDWFEYFSPRGPFPFTQQKTHVIENRRASLADRLILDLLLFRGGIRTPDMLFPPTDWLTLENLLRAIDDSVYDILKKDCLVYILLKWAWDTDPNHTNPGWDVRYVQDRCIPPQFTALADAYWLLDTGTHLAKAVSILSDTRLNRDYVSKILQALVHSSSIENITPHTAALVVKYVRTAKPLLTEPNDIDMYALSLAHISFIDAWAYQKSFPDGSDTRERLFAKMISWCLTPTPKQDPIAQLLALSLSSYEESCLHSLALPSPFHTSATLHVTSTRPRVTLSLHARSILRDLICVRAIQSGGYIRAIKLDREFSSVSPIASGPSSNITSQATRDAIDRKSIIQDLYATLPPAERTLLEDDIGKVATGVRANTLTPRQANAGARRPLAPEPSLSASWEDVARTASPAPSRSAPASSASGLEGKATPVPALRAAQLSSSAAMVTPRPPPTPVRQPPLPKFTAFGSPIPSTPNASIGRGVITERGKPLFSTGATNGLSAVPKSVAHVSLFDAAGSAKNTPNAFYKPPPAPTARVSTNVASVFAGTVPEASKQNGNAPGGESDGEDVSMASGSDVEIIEDDHDASGEEEEVEEVVTEEEDEDEDEDEAEHFIVHDKSEAADLTLHPCHDDERMDDDDAVGSELGFSVFNGAVHNGSASAGDAPISYASPPREADASLGMSVSSATRSRQRVPPGAFHHEGEDENEDEEQDQGNQSEDEEDRVSLTTPDNTPRQSTHTRMQTQTPPRPIRSQPERGIKNTITTTPERPLARSGRPSSFAVSRNIPGSLMDEEEDEDGDGEGDEDEAHYVDSRGDDDHKEQDKDEIAPLPERSTRRTRSTGFVGVFVTTPTKAKASSKAARGVGTGTAATAKGKTKARTSEVASTPARRSSRLSMAPSTSPDQAEFGSPAKTGRKSTTGSRGSTAGIGSTTVVTRSSTRRKR